MQCRRFPYGSTVTYGEIARLPGPPPAWSGRQWPATRHPWSYPATGWWRRTGSGVSRRPWRSRKNCSRWKRKDCVNYNWTDGQNLSEITSNPVLPLPMMSDARVLIPGAGTTGERLQQNSRLPKGGNLREVRYHPCRRGKPTGPTGRRNFSSSTRERPLSSGSPTRSGMSLTRSSSLPKTPEQCRRFDALQDVGASRISGRASVLSEDCIPGSLQQRETLSLSRPAICPV